MLNFNVINYLLPFYLFEDKEPLPSFSSRKGKRQQLTPQKGIFSIVWADIVKLNNNMPNKRERKEAEIRMQREMAESRKTYNKIFVVMFGVFQPLCIFFTGMFVRPVPHSPASEIDGNLLTAMGAFMLLLIGFGLYFSYLRNYNWSGIGFTFFITVISFQFFFLANAFWTRSKVQNSNQTSFKEIIARIYLSNEIFSSSANNTYEATVVGAAKCALSLSVAFSAIGGRAGFLEAFLVVLVGTPIHQLNTELVARFATDYGGTISVFLFGGCMGIIMSLMLSWKQDGMFYAHKQYTSNKMSRTLAVLGSAFLWICFPFINTNLSPSLFIYSHGAISTFVCISGSVATMVGLCLTIDQRVDLKCFLSSIIAGGVIVGSSSTNIYNPLGALMLGVIAAILQYIFCKIDVYMGMKPIWSNGVLFLFVVQGFLGGILSSIFRAINQTSTTFGGAYGALLTDFVGKTGGQIGATILSVIFGSLTGLFTVLLIFCVTKETRKTCYQDEGYWVLEDEALMEKWFDESEKELQVVVQTNEPLKEHNYL